MVYHLLFQFPVHLNKKWILTKMFERKRYFFLDIYSRRKCPQVIFAPKGIFWPFLRKAKKKTITEKTHRQICLNGIRFISIKVLGELIIFKAGFILWLLLSRCKYFTYDWFWQWQVNICSPVTLQLWKGTQNQIYSIILFAFCTPNMKFLLLFLLLPFQNPITSFTFFFDWLDHF